MNSTPASMTTPINNLPVKTNQNADDDFNDPQVQDVLKEFEEELSANKAPLKQPIQSSINNPYQQQYILPPIISQQQIQNQKRLDNIDYDIIKKSLYISILIAIIFYPNLFNSIVEKIPLSFTSYILNYDYYIKILLLFIGIYLLYFYNVA